MSEDAVIAATFSDWQNVKTRGVVKLIFEVPVEQTERVLQILGAPRPDSERWVAIAPLIDSAIQKKRVALLGADRALKQCCLLCKEDKFQRWIIRHIHYGQRTTHGDYPEITEMNARAMVLGWCKIKSRSELLYDRGALERWDDMVGDFRHETGAGE